jgi:hypothetical protein
MTFRLFIVKKMSTFPDETTHIMPRCTMHLCGHRNKMVPFKKPFIFGNLNSGFNFCICTCWLINDTCNYCLSWWVSNHHIGNKDLVFTSHVEIAS